MSASPCSCRFTGKAFSACRRPAGLRAARPAARRRRSASTHQRPADDADVHVKRSRSPVAARRGRPRGAGAAGLDAVAPRRRVVLAIVGLGMGATFPVTTVSVQNGVDQKHLGVATGCSPSSARSAVRSALPCLARSLWAMASRSAPSQGPGAAYCRCLALRGAVFRDGGHDARRSAHCSVDAAQTVAQPQRLGRTGARRRVARARRLLRAVANRSICPPQDTSP